MYERFIERAEQTWYMSPFELAAAMYFQRRCLPVNLRLNV